MEEMNWMGTESPAGLDRAEGMTWPGEWMSEGMVKMAQHLYRSDSGIKHIYRKN